jgi:hypothetical protein
MVGAITRRIARPATTSIRRVDVANTLWINAIVRRYFPLNQGAK